VQKNKKLTRTGILYREDAKDARTTKTDGI
jgi:isopentenyl diphosphate isomerase/L-lactate dehydrogenase-like FMN-dependent dehydrogenase